MIYRLGAAAVLIGAVALPAPALAAECKISKVAELPVTMVSRKPIVTMQINGRDARFILDSGAAFSTLSQATAREYGLPVEPAPPGMRMTGIGGSTSLGIATVKAFGIAGETVRGVQFAVGGSDVGYAGLIGQNVLGLVDVEYDLPHGVVRLVKAQGCRSSSLAYWAGTKPFALVELEPASNVRKSIGIIKVNGEKVRAEFDSGASNSLLDLPVARRMGIAPDKAGLPQTGFVAGIGQTRVRVWRTQFDAIDIGGEAIRKPWIDVIEREPEEADMLVGIDFFLTHRIYVDNQARRMFVTYEGGPLFGLDPKGAFDSNGAALDLTDKAGEPTDAAGYSRRGAVFATDRKFDAAIADFDKAVALAPDNAQYLVQRAQAYLANRQPLRGAADLDKAIGLAPTDSDALLARAQMRSANRDPVGALADLKAADAALAPQAEARLRLAAGYDANGAFELALASYDLWLKAHPEDVGRAVALNGRCRSRALLNRDLDKALDDCEAALRLRHNEAAYLDSRGLVRFRRGEFDKALADYDAVLAVQPRNGLALYTRAVIERRMGKTADADKDRANALAINPQVAERAKRFRLEE